MLRFRESFRGYNRDDVNAYISQLNVNFSKKEAELRAIISDMQVSAENARNEQNNALEAELCNVKAELDASRVELERVKRELAEANSRCEAESNEKSRLYDSMTSQVGGIIIQANANADKIVAEARAEAESIRQNAIAEARNTVADAERIRAEARTYAENSIRTAKEACISEYDSIITGASSELMTACDRITTKTNAIFEALKVKEKIIEANLNSL